MKKQKKETDYKALYGLGFIFMMSGIALLISIGVAGIGIFALGLIFFLEGLSKKDKWKKKKR
jgi:hypothetical protein